jgi:hypothetical protein
MWRISRTSGTLQEILIMASMNLLHTSRMTSLSRAVTGATTIVMADIAQKNTIPPLT